MKWRTVAIAMVVALALGMFVAGFYGSDVLDESVRTFFIESKMPDVFVEFTQQVNSSEVSPVLEGSPDVDEYELRLKANGVFVYEGEAYATILVGTVDPRDATINQLDLSTGSFFTSSGQGVAVIGMEEKGIKEGSQVTVTIANRSLTVDLTGTVRSPEWIYTSAYGEYSVPVVGTLAVIYMPLEDLQAFIGAGVNEAIVLVEDGGSKEAVVTSLEPFGVDAVTFLDTHPSVVFMEIGSNKMRSMFPLLGVIFLFIGFITIFMTMMRLVQTDSRYIGVMMSLGYDRREIVKSYLYLGLLICAVGTVFGILVALGFTYMFVKVGMEMYFSVDIVFPFTPLPFIGGFFFIIGSVLLSFGLPVLIITRATVREALEYRPRAKVWASKVLSGRMSRVTLMGFRNVVRNPARMTITVLVVGLTIATAGMWLVVMDSAATYMNDQVEAETWDLRADFATPLNTSSIDAFFLNLGPTDAEYIIPFAHLTVQAVHGGESMGTILVGSEEVERLSDYSLYEGEADFERVVISMKLATDMDVWAGDNIGLVIGPNRIDLEIAGVLETGMVSAAYTKRANLDRSTPAPLFPPDQSSGVFVKLEDEELAKDKAMAIRSNPQVSKVIVHENIVETFNDLMDMAYSFLFSFFLMSAAITLAVAGSAVIISSMERDVEYATLDTLGITKGKVAKSILVEMGVMGLAASAIGIPLSYVLGKLLAVVLKDVIFYFPVVLVMGAAITIFIMGLFFVMLSSYMPIQYARKLDTETTIRERTAA